MSNRLKSIEASTIIKLFAHSVTEAYKCAMYLEEWAFLRGRNSYVVLKVEAIVPSNDSDGGHVLEKCRGFDQEELQTASMQSSKSEKNRKNTSRVMAS